MDDFKSKEIAYEYFSFIFWTLSIISLLKYAFIVLRADDNGEGKVFLTTLEVEGSCISAEGSCLSAEAPVHEV